MTQAESKCSSLLRSRWTALIMGREPPDEEEHSNELLEPSTTDDATGDIPAAVAD
jgi:hypothetical protein